MKKQINLIITTEKLAKDISERFDEHKVKYYILPDSRGFSYKFQLLEYMGFADTKRIILAFGSSGTTRKKIESYILKHHNKKNNGIIFTVKEKNMKTENKLFVAIINAGKASKLVDLIREKCEVGATVIDGRGSGNKDHKLFGVSIDSNKEIVLSVMTSTKVKPLQKSIKAYFKEDNTDVVSFELPVENFSKLFQPERSE